MLEIELKFSIDGRQVSLHGFVDAVNLRLVEAVKNAINQQLSNALPIQTRPQNTKPEPRAFSIAEAANLLSVSKATIVRRIREGKIGAVHIDSRVLVPSENIQTLLRVDS
jgi:excisionase family DNA binding protein